MKTTEQILNKIKSGGQFRPREERLNDDISNFLIDELKDINRKQMFTQIDMDPQNGNKYIKGERKINRDILIKIFIYLEYDLNKCNQVFKTYGFPQLYAKNKRDSALIYCIYNHYTFAQTKRYLQDHKITLL